MILAPDGSVRGVKGDGKAAKAILDGATTPDFSRLTVRALVVLAVDPQFDELPGLARMTAHQRDAFRQWWPAFVSLVDVTRADAKTFPAARIVEIPKADHYVFISDRARVLEEIRAFGAALP